MIKIGTDIIEIARVGKNMENPRFMERIYTEEELASLGEPLLAESLAARFAAKEATIKALGEGVPFREIAVLRMESGKPILQLTGAALASAKRQNLTQWEVSLSHCREYAVAFVVAMKEDTICD